MKLITLLYHEDYWCFIVEGEFGSGFFGFQEGSDDVVGKVVETQGGIAEVFETVVDRFREAVATVGTARHWCGDQDQHGA